MPWARASALHRHVECPAASWLPRLDRGHWSPGYLAEGAFVAPDVEVADRDTSAADWGTAMHLAKADPATAVDPWRTVVDPHRELLWPARLGVHEQAVSYNCRTRAVELGPVNRPTEEMDGWKNGRDPDCVVGTCDWWATLPTGVPWVDDLKTGWRRPDVTTPQLMFYAMCRAKVAESATCYISITHWPKADPEPSRDGLWRLVTTIALDGFEEELHHAWVRAVGLSPDARPGPHCTYCPSASVCDRAYG